MPYRSAILAAVEDLKDHQTGSPASSIRRRIREHDASFAAALADADDPTAWNEALFQSTLKSLVSKGTLVASGSNYKFSDEHLRRRSERLRERAESLEERRRERARQAHGAAREEPPKECPKRKPVHAKVKMNEGSILTVVDPDGRRKKRKDEDEMETDDEEGEVVAMENGGRRRPVKIIPRKVEPKKKM
ncbi:hypothetical protein ACHAWF_018307 [Thalassiosira exigua]